MIRCLIAKELNIDHRNKNGLSILLIYLLQTLFHVLGHLRTSRVLHNSSFSVRDCSVGDPRDDGGWGGT